MLKSPPSMLEATPTPLMQHLLNISEKGIVLANADGQVIAINTKFTELTGYTLKDFIKNDAKNVVEINIYDFGLTDNTSINRAKAQITHNKSWQDTIFRKHATGKLIQLKHQLTPISIAPKADITHLILQIEKPQERKQAQSISVLPDEQEYQLTLLREVHHRIKNNLQAVSSLMENFALMHPELRMDFNTIITQLQSFSSLHGILSIDSQGGIDLFTLIKSICANNQTFWNIPIHIHFPEQVCAIRINEASSASISLIINELFNNAAKHSYPAREVTCLFSIDPMMQALTIQISNPALPHPIENQTEITESVHIKPHDSTSGQGRPLAQSLLPKHATLDWHHNEGRYTASLKLSTPLIHIEQMQINS